MSERDRDDADRASKRDFQGAVDRLEQAVEEVVRTARDQLSDRATAIVEETTDRLQRELGNRRYERSSRRRRRRRRGYRAGRDDDAASAGSPGFGLYRDKRNEKICGVCAGLARYFGVETWIVRLIAVTGLLFLPQIVLPAYFIAYFVMGDDPERDRGKRRPRDTRRPPERPAREAPRHDLREAQAELSQVELKLRRMESHVTSGQYELQRELKRISD